MSEGPRTAPSDRPTPAERVWHFLSLIAIGSLFAIYGLRRLVVDGDASTGVALTLLAVQTLPLLVFLPALLGGSARAAAYLSFVSILYFGAGVRRCRPRRTPGRRRRTLLRDPAVRRNHVLRPSARPQRCGPSGAASSGRRRSNAARARAMNPRALTRMAGRKLAP